MDTDWIGPVSDPYPIQSEPYMLYLRSNAINGPETTSTSLERGRLILGHSWKLPQCLDPRP
jgi:hypothetical protein